jgi:hypothetical protein
MSDPWINVLVILDTSKGPLQVDENVQVDENGRVIDGPAV